jgi:hypothetical protein
MPTSISSSRFMSAGHWLARLNFAAGWLAAILVLFGLALFAVGQLSADRHAGLWGLFLSAFTLPFSGAFWLSGIAWRNQWRFRVGVQLMPALVFVAWMAFEWWWRAST